MIFGVYGKQSTNLFHGNLCRMMLHAAQLFSPEHKEEMLRYSDKFLSHERNESFAQFSLRTF